MYSQSSDIDPGFTATDPDTDPSNITSSTEYFRVDSDNTTLIKLQDIKEINNIGNYKIVYTARDNFNNTANAERTNHSSLRFPKI